MNDEWRWMMMNGEDGGWWMINDDWWKLNGDWWMMMNDGDDADVWWMMNDKWL